MLRIVAIMLLTLSLSASCSATDISPTVKPLTKQSYGTLLTKTDTSALPASVKSDITRLTRDLKRQAGAACLQFHGPSGTDKIMAASFLATQLGRPLFRVDLAAVMSKYIGETEKNLNRVFSTAQAHDWILLFDEADALFGKRSEVKDTHDRYANIDTNYLLARLEQSQGIWILASNLRMDLDSALEKRCSYQITFP